MIRRRARLEALKAVAKALTLTTSTEAAAWPFAADDEAAARYRPC
ncbi:hypothetical protein [Rhizobium sullae]|nr:hypothetical protein [Rhizobium sullae]